MSAHIHILGICGTFMGGVAALARAAGQRVTGSDEAAWPPMSDQLERLGIDVVEGYDPAALDPAPDTVIIGNALSRGNPAVEHVLAEGLAYTSGPAWLASNVLGDRRVLAVAGTHGKTTAASMLAWILEHAGLAPGFLIGGVAQNFGVSARLGESPFFVVEADEYDSAFFDKRSKFVHYRPRTLVLNNLEYDHADIFPDLAAIRRQFHHLVRTVPGNGLIVHNAADANLAAVLDMGCWTPTETFATGSGDAYWSADGDADATVRVDGKAAGTLTWNLQGRHNVANALAAIAAARHAGVPVADALTALAGFKGVQRRMQLLGRAGGIAVYDDFAHHPTAVATTLDGLRHSAPNARIVAVLEPRSRTMKLGAHGDDLQHALARADAVYLLRPDDVAWDMQAMIGRLGTHAHLADTVESLLSRLLVDLRAGDEVVIMSNGGFGGLQTRLMDALHRGGEAA